MGLLVRTDDRGVKVCRLDKVSQNCNPYTQYSLCVSSKDKDGNWVNGFIDCQFKKGVEVSNKSVINISNAFYTVSEYNGKKYYKLMITDFKVMADGESFANPGGKADDFINIPDNIPDGELPFE